MHAISAWHTGRAIALAICLTSVAAPVGAQSGGGVQVAIDPDDIGGVVRGVSGPEAGVWVIAETTDLPTKFARMVVTDEGEIQDLGARLWARRLCKGG